MFLDKAAEAARRETRALKGTIPPAEMERQALRAARRPRPSFREALCRPGLGIIGEIKRASPSRGRIREDFDPAGLARGYRGHADALSVLTEATFFEGSPDHLLRAVRACPEIPCLRKDFLVDPYQICHARVLGASAVLLIAALLEDGLLRELQAVAGSLGMDALVEVHDATELERALASGADIIGINNRDLTDLSVSLETTRRLAPRIPSGCVRVSESGFGSGSDVQRLHPVSVDAILVGESFMRSGDVGRQVREFRDAYRG